MKSRCLDSAYHSSGTSSNPVSIVPDPSDLDLGRSLHQLDDISATDLIMNVIEPKLADLDDIIDSPDRKKKLMKFLIDGLIILQATDNGKQDKRL